VVPILGIGYSSLVKKKEEEKTRHCIVGRKKYQKTRPGDFNDGYSYSVLAYTVLKSLCV